jgi:amidophosphoribosyltransferase
VHRRCRGGYAAVAMLVGHGVVAFRDPFGIRPLVVGYRGEGSNREYMVASESVALDVLGFACSATSPRARRVHRRAAPAAHAAVRREPGAAPCIFEHVYFARPDS